LRVLGRELLHLWIILMHAFVEWLCLILCNPSFLSFFHSRYLPIEAVCSSFTYPMLLRSWQDGGQSLSLNCVLNIYESFIYVENILFSTLKFVCITHYLSGKCLCLANDQAWMIAIKTSFWYAGKFQISSNITKYL